MKLVTFIDREERERLGLIKGEEILDLAQGGLKLGQEIPSNIMDFLHGGESILLRAHSVSAAFEEGEIPATTKVGKVTLLSPIPRPLSCRDAYAFRQHVAAGRKNRGVEMIPEFDEFPVFYFTNHLAVAGPGEVRVEEDHLLRLDFELEVAVVIGKRGKNISAQDADGFIAGYTIMNDFSARQLQKEEMKLNLGPAKGKDFATALGPYLVTMEEMALYQISTPDDRSGSLYDLEMKAYHNGELVSEGNFKDITYTFAEIIERVSYGTEIYPGEVIGSGTVGTGCFLELNGTGARLAAEEGRDFEPTWLNEGDTIELEVTGLGKLTNTIVLNPGHHRILDKKRKL